MLDNGWIKLHRKLLCNPIVCKDAEHLAVWIYLLLQATHEDRQAIFNGEKINLSAGQLLTSRNKIANKLKISSSKVYRILECLKNEQAIEQVTDNRQSLITLNNWELYQCDSEQVIEQQVNNQARKKGKEQEKFSPHTPFSKEKVKENKENNKNTTTTTRTREDDVLVWREIHKNGEPTGCCLFISNNQLLALAEQLSESEMDYYIDKVSAMVESGYKFTCSHYEYILKLVEEDRKVS